MNLETKYAYQKRLRELEDELLKARNLLFQYRNVMMRLYSWLTPFAKAGTESPNAAYGLEQMKELFK